MDTENAKARISGMSCAPGETTILLCFKSKRTMVSESNLIENNPPLDLRRGVGMAQW